MTWVGDARCAMHPHEVGWCDVHCAERGCQLHVVSAVHVLEYAEVRGISLWASQQLVRRTVSQDSQDLAGHGVVSPRDTALRKAVTFIAYGTETYAVAQF